MVQWLRALGWGGEGRATGTINTWPWEIAYAAALRGDHVLNPTTGGTEWQRPSSHNAVCMIPDSYSHMPYQADYFMNLGARRVRRLTSILASQGHVDTLLVLKRADTLAEGGVLKIVPGRVSLTWSGQAF